MAPRCSATPPSMATSSLSVEVWHCRASLYCLLHLLLASPTTLRFGTVDLVCFSPEFKFVGHALKPVVYERESDALVKLLPSLEMPSDHLPVVVDLSLPPLTASTMQQL